MFSVYPLCVVACVAVLASEGLSLWPVVLTALVLVVGIAGANALLSISDIVVDHRGISRSLFGKTWQAIRWDNIRIIKTFPIRDPDTNKMIRGFNIYPLIRPRFDLMAFGKMSFLEKAENMSKLIELINQFVSIYKIEIEAQANGAKTSAGRL
jgi:hypothetical protein